MKPSIFFATILGIVIAAFMVTSATADDHGWIDRGLIEIIFSVHQTIDWCHQRVADLIEGVHNRVADAEWKQRLQACHDHPKCKISEERDDNPVFWKESPYRWTRCAGRTAWLSMREENTYEDCRYLASQPEDDRDFQYRHECAICNLDAGDCELIRHRRGMCMYPPLRDQDKAALEAAENVVFDDTTFELDTERAPRGLSEPKGFHNNEKTTEYVKLV